MRVIQNVSSLDVIKTDLNVSRQPLIVMSSWSSNEKKGMSFYRFLDFNFTNLGCDVRYYGNSDVKFKNIKFMGAVSPKELVKVYQTATIFLSASRDDPCSNAGIEARDAGMITVCLNSGGHPEITSHKEFLFDTKIEMMEALNKALNKPIEIGMHVGISDDRKDKCYSSYIHFIKSTTRKTPRLRSFLFFKHLFKFNFKKILSHV